MEVLPACPILEFLPNTIENVRKLCGLDECLMKQSIDILEKWVEKQPHFVVKNISREQLEKVIITCKGSVEKAKIRIDRLCTYKTLLPSYFISSNIQESFRCLNEIAYTIPLPKITKDCYERLFIIKINNKEYTSAHFLDYLRLNIVICEYLKKHDYVNGFVIIYDYRDVDLMNLMSKLNIVIMQQFMNILIEGYGARLKCLHMISSSKAIEILVRTTKSFLSEKIGKRIQVHSDIESLYKFVDKDLLPVDFGGNERSLKELQDSLMKELGSPENEKHLALMRAIKTDESQRQSDNFNEQYMGLPGSFKTLTVD